MVYAIDRFFLGDTNPDGTPNANAWTSIGFDLDGVDTSDPATSPNCKQPDSQTSVLLDGICGVDNTFGSWLVPFVANASANETALATTGAFTLLFRVNGASGGGSASAVSGAVYSGAPLGSPPKFDGSDVWPPTLESAPSGNVPVAQWSAGNLVDGKLVVTEPMTVFFDFAVPPATRNERYAVQVRVLELDFSTDATEITHGVLAGVVSLDAVGSALELCGGGDPGDPRTYLDILASGRADPSETCDSMSFAFGFSAKAIREIATAEPTPPALSDCPDGG
jgi:hypothetical protein